MLSQVTESGMNSSTMAREMHKQLQLHSEVSTPSEANLINCDSQDLDSWSPSQSKTIKSTKPVTKWITNFNWDPKTVHNFCACHNLGLVVKHGLAALGINSRASQGNKKTVLGRFLVVDMMPVIGEKDNEVEGSEDKALDNKDEDKPDNHPDEILEEAHHSDAEVVSNHGDELEDEETRRLCKSLDPTSERPASTKDSMANLYQNVSRLTLWPSQNY